MKHNALYILLSCLLIFHTGCYTTRYLTVETNVLSQKRKLLENNVIRLTYRDNQNSKRQFQGKVKEITPDTIFVSTDKIPLVGAIAVDQIIQIEIISKEVNGDKTLLATLFSASIAGVAIFLYGFLKEASRADIKLGISNQVIDESYTPEVLFKNRNYIKKK